MVFADSFAHIGREEMREMMEEESKWRPARGAATYVIASA